MSRTHYKTLIESDWLGQWDLVTKDGKDIRPTVTIASVEPYKPAGPRKKKRLADGSYADEKFNKLVIGFRGKRKKWLSGPATQQVIAGIYGPMIEDWIGKPITLYVDHSVKMGRRTTGGIRVVNVAPTEAPTDEPLDNAPDNATAERISEAFADEETGRQPGED